MKILDLSPITSVNEFPVKSGTLQFIQDSYKESLAQALTSLVEVNDPTQVYILSGLHNTGTGTTYNVTSGVVYFNGELFDVAAFSFTLTGSQLPYPSVVTTQYTTNADPVTFTDGTPRNVHNIRTFVVTNTTTYAGIMEFDNWFRVAPWLKGDTKEIVCDATYMSNNFDSTGLGIKERTGWAIMNGNNGTHNDSGLVVVAYGASYSTLGATGGTPNTVLIGHTHTVSPTEAPTYGSNGAVRTTWGPSAGDTGAAGTTTPLVTSTAGGSETGIGKNLQPYVVRLRIQKI